MKRLKEPTSYATFLYIPKTKLFVVLELDFKLKKKKKLSSINKVELLSIWSRWWSMRKKAALEEPRLTLVI